MYVVDNLETIGKKSLGILWPKDKHYSLFGYALQSFCADGCECTTAYSNIGV